MDRTEREIAYKVKLDTSNGAITIDLLDVIRQLTEEQRKEMMFDGGWWSFISKEMFRDITEGFAGENFNPVIHEFRKSLLTSDAMPPILRRFMESVVRDTVSRIQYLKRYEEAYWTIYHAVRENNELRKMANDAYVKTEISFSKSKWVNEFVTRLLSENDITFPKAEKEEGN